MDRAEGADKAEFLDPKGGNRHHKHRQNPDIATHLVQAVTGSAQDQKRAKDKRQRSGAGMKLDINGRLKKRGKCNGEFL